MPSHGRADRFCAGFFAGSTPSADVQVSAKTTTKDSNVRNQATRGAFSDPAKQGVFTSRGSEVVAIMNKLVKKTPSYSLSQVAAAARSDTFGKVKGLIEARRGSCSGPGIGRSIGVQRWSIGFVSKMFYRQAMIDRLEKEAAEEVCL